MIRYLVCWILLVGWSAAAEPAFEKLTEWNDLELKEISGVAVSRANAGILWVHNDSGGGARLYALDTSGKRRANVAVDQALPIDWEDAAGFTLDGQPYIAIADIGDNYAIRPTATIYVIADPVLPPLEAGDTAVTSMRLQPAWSVTFTYPGGARDAESMAVDVQNNRFLVLSKRDAQPILFSLPLKPKKPGTVVATELGKPPGLPQPVAEKKKMSNAERYGHQPTAMDLSTDGRHLLVISYQWLLRYELPVGGSWSGISELTPTVQRLPAMPQAEAACWEPSGGGIWLLSEQTPTPLYHMSFGKAE